VGPRPGRAAALLAVTLAPVLHGEVEAVRGSTVTLRGPQGQRVDVDVGAIHAGADRLLLPGRRVSLLGVVARDDGRLAAQGIAVEYGAPAVLVPRDGAPAASPPGARPSPVPVPAPAAAPPAAPAPVPQAPAETPPGIVTPPQEPTLGPGAAPTPR
jgi:2-oxoglutarate dehydrogenase E2 component (dihydrolipoamide succinyltransferase)